MLFNQSVVKQYVNDVTGVFHVGAHDCQEDSFYKQFTSDIIWLDAIEEKVAQGKAKGHRVFHATVTDKDDEEVVFKITNNEQSSSVLDLGTHATEHPDVVFVKEVSQKSITVDTFFERNGIDPSRYTFWNFDIQGAELLALKGAKKSLQYAKVLYLEVNTKELYKGCGLIGDIDEFLAGYNFKRVQTMVNHHGWGDAIYIKTGLKE
jgi:FkbM family methyltransferase